MFDDSLEVAAAQLESFALSDCNLFRSLQNELNG